MFYSKEGFYREIQAIPLDNVVVYTAYFGVAFMFSNGNVTKIVRYYCSYFVNY